MNILTAEDARKLVQVISPRSPFGTRDRGILILLMHTGLRVSELCSINVGQVWHSKGRPRRRLQVKGKGSRFRVIELNQTAQKAIRVLINFNEQRGFSTEPTSPLLVNRKHKRLGRRAVHYLSREAADLDTPVSPHSARHAFATVLIEKSVPTRVVQDLLGTSVYRRPKSIPTAARDRDETR